MLTRKVLLLGEIAVGKTSLARRLVFDTFETDYKATIGVDLYSHDTMVEGADGPVDLRLVLWDIDGDLGETIFNHTYARGASAAVIIGDGVRPATVETMLRLAHGFRECFAGRPLIYVVNKADLFVDAGNSDGLPAGLPDGLNDPAIPLHVTSARSGANVASAFEDLSRAVFQARL